MIKSKELWLFNEKLCLYIGNLSPVSFKIGGHLGVDNCLYLGFIYLGFEFWF